MRSRILKDVFGSQSSTSGAVCENNAKDMEPRYQCRKDEVAKLLKMPLRSFCEKHLHDLLAKLHLRVIEQRRDELDLVTEWSALLLDAIVDVFTSQREVVAQILTDPGSCGRFIMQAFHSEGQSIVGKRSDLLKRIMERVIQDGLVGQGIEQDDADLLLEILLGQKMMMMMMMMTFITRGGEAKGRRRRRGKLRKLT